jgi:hypothetical protein
MGKGSILPSFTKRKLSFAAMSGLFALLSYVCLLLAASRLDWRELVVELRDPNADEKNAKLTIGLLGGTINVNDAKVIEWKLQHSDGKLSRKRTEEQREEFLSFRYYTVGFYSSLIVSTLMLALGTLFIIWSSKPTLNVLGSLVFFSVAVFLCFFGVFFELWLTSKVHTQLQCVSVIFEFLETVNLPTITEDCEWKRGKAPWLLWTGTLLAVVAWAIAVVRIIKYRLPFMAKAIEEIMAVKAMAANPNFDDASSVAQNSPRTETLTTLLQASTPSPSPTGVRERMPLLTN